MGYWISAIIGIRTGGVFSGTVDVDKLRIKAQEIWDKLSKQEQWAVSDIDFNNCMSTELTATKGSYVIIAGIFNYGLFTEMSSFCKRLSVEFETEIMLMFWDEERGVIECNVFSDGEYEFESTEIPLATCRQ